MRAGGGGKPMAAVLRAGDQHEQFALCALMDKGAMRRPGRGRPRLRPRWAAGDRGYSSPSARRRLKQRRIEPVIPPRKDQPRRPDFDKAAYRQRNKVERLINRLKPYRRIATRYEKRATNYRAMVTFGMTMLWLTRVCRDALVADEGARSGIQERLTERHDWVGWASGWYGSPASP